MVKEDSFSSVIPGSLQDFCALFEDPKTFIRYHEEVNGNPHIKVADWENGSRRIAFLCPYEAPTWLKRAVGTDVVKIRDYQEITKEVDPETSQLTSLSMVSNPQLYVPGRKDDLHIATTNFSATRIIMPDGTPGVEVVASLTCSADGLKFLWAFKGAIENVMMYQCKHIAFNFVDFCEQRLREQTVPIPPGTPPPNDTATSLHQAAAAVVRAVAAAEDRSEGSMVDGGRVIAAGPGTPPGGCNGDGVEVRLWLEDAAEAGAWYDAASGSDSGAESPSPRAPIADGERLREMQHTANQTMALLHSLHERQLVMENDLRAMRQRVAPTPAGLQSWLAEASPFVAAAVVAVSLGSAFAAGYTVASRRRRRTWF